MDNEYLKALLKFHTADTRMPILPGILIGTLLFMLAFSANAHHSWGAIYNGGDPVNVTAVIINKPYRNPHDRVDVTIVNETGEAEEWRIEWRGRRAEGGAGRGQTAQYDLNPGDEVLIEGRTANNPDLMAIQMAKLTRVSDGMTIEARLDRSGGQRGRSDGGRRQRDQ